MRIAIVTCTAYAEGRPDDVRVAELLGAEFRVWDDQSVDWQAYDRVVIRTPWDYSERRDEFVEWAFRVGAERLRNTPEVIAFTFNSDKRYLGTLQAPIAPTIFLEPGQALPEYQREVVVKPNISAGARDTGRFEPEAAEEAAELVAVIHATGRTALVQPYLAGVDEQGETAVMFFNGEISHVLAKRPVLRSAGVAPRSEIAHGPAAVMLEHDLVGPGQADAAQLSLARAVHDEISERFGVPLYIRVDMVPGQDGSPVIMELEMIEPNLYLELAQGLWSGLLRRFAPAETGSE